MKLTKFDIGAEIISILTRGMYPDPRDAVREYIQNGIDAGAKHIDVKVRQNSVVIEDYGSGMDYKTLRKALRVGVSDKTPGKDVGFMGIGIYSAFHLCNKLTIYTRKKNMSPQILSMDFEGMRTVLKDQQELRLNKEITSEDLTDLQTLLETYIDLPDEGTVEEDEYPIEHGTRVELVGLDRELDDLLNSFDDLANYLRDVVPLHFSDKFKWGKMIEEKIAQVCKQHNAHFQLVNINLQVGSQITPLYRPYTDEVFSNDTPFEPDFFDIKSGHTFIGIAWGCLNSSRDRLKLPRKNDNFPNLRGFIIKKQGFSIGKRDDLSQYFGNSNTFYHRYTGEVIIVNNDILPNAARNGLEASDLKKKFLYQLQTKVAPHYIFDANKFQEEDKAREVLEKQGNELKRVLVSYNPNEDNPDNILRLIGATDEIIEALKSKKNKNKFNPDDKKEAQKLINSAEKLNREILIKFNDLTNKKKPRKRRPNKSTTTEVAEDLSGYSAKDVITYESLTELIQSVDIDFNDDVKKILDLIDETFIQAVAKTKNNYYQLLNQLKDDFEND